MNRPFGERLQELRKSRNLNQHQLATLTQLSVKQIKKIESSLTPTVKAEYIKKLADGLEISYDELLGYKPMRSKEKISDVEFPFIMQNGIDYKEWFTTIYKAPLSKQKELLQFWEFINRKTN